VTAASRYPAVAVAGFLGATARYGLTLATPGHAALTTAAINTAGALVLGVLTALWAAGRGPGGRTPWLRAALGPGFLGAFTTFSAIAAATASAPHAVPAWASLLAQVSAGIAAAWLGLALGARAGRRRAEPAGGSGGSA